MKVAAVQMNAIFADVQANLEKIRHIVREAALKQVQLIVFPEFCTSAIAFSEKMIDVTLQNQNITESIKSLSEHYDIVIGGSTLQFDGHNAYNVFQLVFPNGQVYSHKKDIPTQFENCYYTKGDTVNLLQTPIGNIGVALCWEMLRYDTVKRLLGKSDVVLAGSCWWDLPDDAPPSRESLRKYNQHLAVETPLVFAQLLKVPVIHSSHCGEVTAFDFPNAQMVQKRHFIGAAQIIDQEGKMIASRSFEQGEGLVISDLKFAAKEIIPTEIPTEKYWIPDLPIAYINAWKKSNPIGEIYYENISLPKYKKLLALGRITQGAIHEYNHHSRRNDREN